MVELNRYATTCVDWSLLLSLFFVICFVPSAKLKNIASWFFLSDEVF